MIINELRACPTFVKNDQICFRNTIIGGGGGGWSILFLVVLYNSLKVGQIQSNQMKNNKLAPKKSRTKVGQKVGHGRK